MLVGKKFDLKICCSEFFWPKNVGSKFFFGTNKFGSEIFFDPKKFGSEIYGLIWFVCVVLLFCLFSAQGWTEQQQHRVCLGGGVVVGGLAVAIVSNLNLMLVDVGLGFNNCHQSSPPPHNILSTHFLTVLYNVQRNVQECPHMPQHTATVQWTMEWYLNISYNHILHGMWRMWEIV